MGKRKERRLAAMSASGRRVKLDLFAEPSGDLGGSSAKDEVRKDVDAKLDAELPNLPSSSGKQVENPLSLLGQYSDDDLDEGSNDTTSKQDDSLGGDDNEVKVSEDILSEAAEVGGGEDVSSQKADNYDLETDSAVGNASLGEADAVLSNKVISDENHEVNIENEDPTSGACDNQTTGGVSSCWKMVLHEESNRYYYWNTVTGETSWEVPDALTLGTGLADEHRMLDTSMVEGAAGSINASNAASGVKLDDFSTRDVTGYANGVSDVTAASDHRSETIQSVEQSEGAGSLLLGSSNVAAAFPYGTPALGSYSMCGQLNASVGSPSAGCQEVHGYSTVISPQGAIDFSSHVLRHAELILDRLKLLQGSGSDQHGWISKYMLEIEVRLSDIRSLLCHGSSLDPFWLHSETQLSRLENAINAEIVEQNNRISGMHLSSTEGKEEKLEDREETKVNTDMKALSPESCADIHNADVPAIVQKTSLDTASDGHILNLQQISEQNHSAHLDDKEINRAACQGKTSPKAEFQPGEDVDMDIDMELEDPSPARIDMRGQLLTPQQLIQASAPMTEQSLGPDSEFIIPPPPEEEWIPPPPPDNEGIPPPPPPDEPPELCQPPPPSESEVVQSGYNEQYNVTYGGSNVHYFDSSSTDASGSSFYQLADGSQVASLNSAVYYTAASTMQPTAVPNPVESVVYYGHQNGVMPIVPVESIASSGLQAASGQMNYGDLSSKQIATVGAVAENPLSNQHIDSSIPGTNAGAASSEVSSTSVVSAPPTVSAKEYVSVPPSSAAATSTMVTSSAVMSDVPVPVPKAQSKASKVKKSKVSVTAASSLRSNKKVSSLVDKWKAAKEELQEEEEEQRETPLEILEKKRQREIEEWRAQQIASGEAKENANFQPLGGDWRVRVKRRRAQKGATVEASSDAAPNDTSSTKQPDLSELSRDLPSGWQAYWDESSRQVYYANSITSETTWTRPTR